MKAIIISEGVSNIIYFWHDDEFTQQLHSITDVNIESNDDINSCIQSYFTPLILSYVSLKSKLDENCSYLECEEKNLLVVFQQHHQFIYVALENANNQSKERLMREIGFLRSSIGLLFGPCGHHQLSDQRILRKKRAWEKISCVFKSYTKLCSEENSFLLEGIENLQINKEVTSASKILIENCIKSYLGPVIRKELQYVMIFVDAKLLYLYRKKGVKKTLSTCTFLQIISLLHSNISKSDVFFPAQSIFDSNSDNESQTHCNSQNVSLHKMSNSIFSDDPDDDTMLLKTDLDFLYENAEIFSETSSVATSSMPNLSLSGNCSTDEDNVEKFSKSSVSSFSESGDSEDGRKDPLYANDYHFSSEDDSDFSQLVGHFEIPIYASTKKSRFVPHVLHCASITNNIKMVFLTKNKNSVMSDVICGTLYWLQKLRFIGDKIEGAEPQTQQKLKTCLSLLCSKNKKLDEKLRSRCMRLRADWMKTGDVYLQSVIESANEKDLLKLEHSTNKLEHQLRYLFCALFPSLLERKKTSCAIDLPKVQVYAERKLSGYVDYLSVKAQQNVTMTAYLNKFPGMVHFAFLSRSRSSAGDDGFLLQSNQFDDELITPSLSSSQGAVSDVFPSLKKKFWNSVYSMLSSIISGECIISQGDEDFVFTSHTWCSSKSAFPVNTQIPVKRKYSSHVSTTVFNFDEDFYKDFILSYCDVSPKLHVFQLFCVHFSVVPLEVVNSQLEQLHHLLSQDIKLK